jgi:hypothetical protein
MIAELENAHSLIDVGDGGGYGYGYGDGYGGGYGGGY